MPEPQLKDIIFPQQKPPPLSELIGSLRRTTLTIHNRLASIRSDADFVRRAARAFGGRPLVANERCGSWYIPPGDKANSAYFKSTDGHERAWKFSTRRLNLHLVDIIEEHDGVVIVDSTRRGKRMPDALSATVPIWCAVVNRVLLPSHPHSNKLFLPPYYPSSTHSQIAALIPPFAATLRDLNIPLPTTLTKPLRPFWVTQDTALNEEDTSTQTLFDDYRPVICCTASSRVVAITEAEGGGYIQGAADDTENWAHGLTPGLFWSHTEQLLSAEEEDLPDLIASLIQEERQSKVTDSTASSIRLTPRISVCALPLTPGDNTQDECRIALTPEPTPADTWVKSSQYIEVGLGRSKTGSRNLRLALPHITSFASKYLRDPNHRGAQILIACETGKDLSVGTALSLSCYLFDDNCELRPDGQNTTLTKSLVKTRLGGFMTAHPGGNPSRNTLQSVNSFLMDWR